MFTSVPPGRVRSALWPRGARAPRAHRSGLWLAAKAFLFLAVLLLFWLLASRVASEETPPQASTARPSQAAAPAPVAAPAPAEEPSAAAATSADGAPAAAKAPATALAELSGRNCAEIALWIGSKWRGRPDSGPEAAGPDPALFSVRLYDLAIAVAALCGSSEDPRRRLQAVGQELFDRRGFRIVARPSAGSGPEHLLLEDVVARRAGSPLALAHLYLAIAELLSPPLELAALTVPGGAAVRFQDGSLSLNVLLLPGEKALVLRDDQIRERFQDQRAMPGEDHLRPLSRAELAGVILGELAQAARARDELNAAKALLNTALSLAQRRSPIWLELADIARKDADQSGERAAVDGALSADPNHAFALARRAHLQREAGELDAARRDLDRALTQGTPEDPWVYLELGELELELGDAEGARQAYRRLLAHEAPPELRSRAEARLATLELKPLLDTLGGKADYPAKFAALRKLSGQRGPQATEAMIAALRDSNLRLARLAWRALRDSTGQDLPFEPEAWEGWWASGPEKRRK